MFFDFLMNRTNTLKARRRDLAQSLINRSLPCPSPPSPTVAWVILFSIRFFFFHSFSPKKLTMWSWLCIWKGCQSRSSCRLVTCGSQGLRESSPYRCNSWISEWPIHATKCILVFAGHGTCSTGILFFFPFFGKQKTYKNLKWVREREREREKERHVDKERPKGRRKS